MKTKFIEATNRDAGGANWGKFMVAQFGSEEWFRASEIVPPQCLMDRCGWTPDHLLVLDLQTGEGAIFRHGGYARADMDKHRVSVCPMFEPFLQWLYTQDVTDLDALPGLVQIQASTTEMCGYRRPGKERTK